MTLQAEEPAVQAGSPEPSRPSSKGRDSIVAAGATYDVCLDAAFDLGAWRRDRLGSMKQRPEYTRLAPILRQVVDHCVRRYESPDEGITVGQEKLARRFGVHRDTMGRYLCAIVEAGVFTRQYRGRKGCYGQRGRTTNAYRLNDALLSIPIADCRINHRVKDRSGSTSYDVQSEALSSREHLEDAKVKTASPRGGSAVEGAGIAGTINSNTATASYTSDEECPNCQRPYCDLTQACPECADRKMPAVRASQAAWNARAATEDPAQRSELAKPEPERIRAAQWRGGEPPW